MKNGNHQPDKFPVLKLDSISVGNEGQDVIYEIDLELYRGDFTALVDPNGAGKSTLALSAAGLLKPNRGKVMFRGRKRPRPGKLAVEIVGSGQQKLLCEPVTLLAVVTDTTLEMDIPQYRRDDVVGWVDLVEERIIG